MKKIYVGAGHSDIDSGAVGNGEKEAAIATELRDLICDELKRQNAPFAADGYPGHNLPLKESIRIANLSDGPRIEIHCNSADNPNAKGVECLAKSKHKLIAQCLCHIVSTALGIPKRGDDGYQPASASPRSRLAFIEDANGLILELFFISNPSELKSYHEHKDLLASQLAKFLINQASGSI